MSSEFLLSAIATAPDNVVLSRYRQAVKDGNAAAIEKLHLEIVHRGLYHRIKRRAI